MRVGGCARRFGICRAGRFAVRAGGRARRFGICRAGRVDVRAGGRARGFGSCRAGRVDVRAGGCARRFGVCCAERVDVYAGGRARGFGIWCAVRVGVHGGGRAGALRVCGARGRGGLRVSRGVRGRAFAGRCAARDARVRAGRRAVRQRARGVFRCVAGARVRVHDSGRRVFGHLPPKRVYERGRVAVRRAARGRACRGVARGEFSGRRAQPRRHEARALRGRHADSGKRAAVSDAFVALAGGRVSVCGFVEPVHVRAAARGRDLLRLRRRALVRGRGDFADLSPGTARVAVLGDGVLPRAHPVPRHERGRPALRHHRAGRDADGGAEAGFRRIEQRAAHTDERRGNGRRAGADEELRV